MKSFYDLDIELFIDSGEIAEIEIYSNHSMVSGITTNPTLLSQIGVSDYLGHITKLIENFPSLEVSAQVTGDSVNSICSQARLISSLGPNVRCKVPIETSNGTSLYRVFEELSGDGIPLNVTSVFTIEQISKLCNCISPESDTILSVFAGRIADTGRDPELVIEEAAVIFREHNARILWASVREIFNIFQASRSGANIITVPPSLLSKLPRLDWTVEEMCGDTINMFARDARAYDKSVTALCDQLS